MNFPKSYPSNRIRNGLTSFPTTNNAITKPSNPSFVVVNVIFQRTATVTFAMLHSNILYGMMAKRKASFFVRYARIVLHHLIKVVFQKLLF